MSQSQPTMHVIAASFPTTEHAEAARRHLLGDLDLTTADLDLAPLGRHDGVDGHDVVLAARVREPRLLVAERILRAHGGRLVADVPEAWTGMVPLGRADN